MTFHFISIIFRSTDNFFTYLSKEYNIVSVDSKYLQQPRHTQDRKKSKYLGNFAEKSLYQQFEDNMTRSGHIAL
jgi:hypothetical protein